MNIRFFLAKSLRIPRRLHMIYYICFNRFKFWLNDVRFGSNMRVYNKIYLNKARSSKITIGDNSGISSACLWASTSITIGNYVKIGGDCIIMDTDAHSLNFNIRRSIEKNEQGYRVDGLAAATAPIIIEDDVLIGTRCIILKGVIIGARTVIGSGSVVTKSIPADCIAAGNPCRVIKYIER